jgi:hypothetical protein
MATFADKHRSPRRRAPSPRSRRSWSPPRARQCRSIYRRFADTLRVEFGRPPVVGDVTADAIAAYGRQLEEHGGGPVAPATRRVGPPKQPDRGDLNVASGDKQLGPDPGHLPACRGLHASRGSGPCIHCEEPATAQAFMCQRCQRPEIALALGEDADPLRMYDAGVPTLRRAGTRAYPRQRLTGVSRGRASGSVADAQGRGS